MIGMAAHATRISLHDMAQDQARADIEPTRSRDGSSIGWQTTVARNVFVAALVGGLWFALETGYFSNDRTPRALDDLQEQLKKSPRGDVVFEAQWKPGLLADRSLPEGFWDYYNGADKDTVSVTADGLKVTYTEPWIGAYFRHLKFRPSTVYRVVFEANIEGQPAAVLMRNRQLDLLREQIPVTSGEFKEFTAHYVTPGGALDQVRVIFMPDGKKDVQGAVTIRRLRIERLGG